MIDPDVVLGKNVRIYNPEQVNIFGCKIGDDSFVGPFVEITRDLFAQLDTFRNTHIAKLD